MTQKERVLKYMEDFGSITPHEAYFDLGVYRLSAVIYDLKAAGHNIESELVTGKNRYNETTHYSRYRLNREPVQTRMEF